MRRGPACVCLLLALSGFFPTLGRAEIISLDAPFIVAQPGETVSAFFLIRENTTPLLGYSLKVDIAPVGAPIGSAAVNLAMTSFFDARNLITAGGSVRDPFFSDIIDTGDGGVFVTTLTDDLSTVLAADGVNDVLAQVFFDVSLDAEVGDEFQIVLSPGTALSDAGAFPVGYEFAAGTITVVPEPAAFLGFALILGILRRGRAQSRLAILTRQVSNC